MTASSLIDLVAALTQIFVSVAQNMPAKAAFGAFVVGGAIGWDILLRRYTVIGAATLASITVGFPYAFLAYVIFDLSVVGGSFLLAFSPILAFPIAMASIVAMRWMTRRKRGAQVAKTS